jgi:two-component system, OmpR family, sensor kinase
MGSLQVRLFFTYLVIISVTLGLTALSLFLQIGSYRDSISYGNLEDLGRLVYYQATADIRSSVDARDPSAAPVPQSNDLLFALRNFLTPPPDAGRVAEDTSIALIDTQGNVIPGLAATSVPLDGGLVKNLANQRFIVANASDTTPRRCRLELRGRPAQLCVNIALPQTVLQQFPGTQASAIVVARPAASLAEVVNDLGPRLLFSGLIGVAAALVLGFLLSRSVAAPLHNIARAARSVARGNYRQRVPATGPQEVRELASDFNLMTEEVQRSQQTLRDFLANISHELKTPLTSIRGFSEAMLDGTIDDPAGIARSARIISGESNRVLRLVQELLDLSRIESGQVLMRQDDVNVNELFEHVGEVFALRSEEAGVGLEMSLNGSSLIRGDFDRLEQVLNNLLDNAFRHTPAGGVVRVASRDIQAGVLQVTVSDTGVGINPHDVPHLFERFYRANGAGNKKGYGLGLAISREIVRSHGGEIWATSELQRGTAFVFTLPTGGRATPKVAAR